MFDKLRIEEISSEKVDENYLVLIVIRNNASLKLQHFIAQIEVEEDFLELIKEPLAKLISTLLDTKLKNHTYVFKNVSIHRCSIREECAIDELLSELDFIPRIYIKNESKDWG